MFGKATGLAVALAMLSGGVALAAGGSSAMNEYVVEKAAEWSKDPSIRAALASANAAHAGLAEAELVALDDLWRAEVGKAAAPTIEAVTQNAASAFLRNAMKAESGRITEIIVMDSRGMNAATSGVTSDYWQGDEAKYTESYPKGPGAVHVSEVEFDESTQIYQVQISTTLTGPTGAPTGAVTVGLDIDAF